MASLKRYKNYFQIECEPNASKTKLIQAIKQHFAHYPRLRDAEVIAQFLHANNQVKELFNAPTAPSSNAK
jgi:Sin3 binding region of histone deacetylase complex subunit SAP30